MNELAMLLKAAARDSLRGKSAEMFELRFAFLYGEGEILTYDDLAARYGMRRDRVRQLLAKCMTRIRWKASRQIRRGQFDVPCALLFLHLQRQIGSGLSPHSVREFCRRYTEAHEWEVAHLVLTIAVASLERRRSLLSSTKYLMEKNPPQGTGVCAALPRALPSVII